MKAWDIFEGQAISEFQINLFIEMHFRKLLLVSCQRQKRHPKNVIQKETKANKNVVIEFDHKLVSSDSTHQMESLCG